MASYCPQCGRELTEDGKCPVCSRSTRGRAARQEDDPSQFVLAIRSLITFVAASVRNPVLALKKVHEHRDLLTGITMMIVTVTMSLLATLVYALRCRNYSFAAWPWILTGITVPLQAYAMGIGCTILMLLLAKHRIDFKKIVAVTGSAGLLPTLLTLLAVFLTLAGDSAFYILFSAALVSTALMLIITLTKVYDIKMNLWQILIIVGIMTVAYMSLTGTVNWFRNAAQNYHYYNYMWN